MAVAVALATLLSTALGGLVALRYRDQLHLLLGYVAGVLIGVVAFDVLPDIADLAHRTNTSFRVPMIALVAGFLGFHFVEKALLLHEAHEGEYAGHQHPSVGLASALALSAHSFTDGLAIGLAFQINSAVGAAVAVAVVGHDFVDGLNTVSLMLMHGNSPRRASWLLAVDALAPLAGAATTLLFHFSDRVLLGCLGVFAGFLLYIAASDILPEAHAKHPSVSTLLLTAAGAGTMYAVSVGLQALS